MANSPRNQLQSSILPWLLQMITFIACAAAISLHDLPIPGIKSLLFGREHPFASKGRKHMNSKTLFYNQTLDHFNYRPESYKFFSQKYVVNDEYWGGAKAYAPIFVLLGAEASLDDQISNGGFQFDIAPYFGAIVINIEHRYYGTSNPDGTMLKSLEDPEIRGYFSSAQVLADYAEIILFLKEQYKAEYSPVIVFGGSYGGMLATWFRLKYPHVAMGALASSAPIFMTIVPPDTYDNWVNKVYRETSENCYNTIKNSWAEMVKLGSDANGLSLLSQKFNTCSTVNSTAFLGKFLVVEYRKLAQYDGLPGFPLIPFCSAIDGAATGTSDLDKVASAIKAVFSGAQCFDVSPVLPSVATQPGASDGSFLGLIWQTCTELLNPMGFIFNASIADSMLPMTPFDLETFTQECTQFFGIRPTRPKWVETYYGAQDLKLYLKRFGSNIIFSNGLKDPYSQEGVLEDISDTLVAINTANGYHCADLKPAMKTDPEWLTEMRNKEVEIVKGWLTLYYADLRAYLKT